MKQNNSELEKILESLEFKEAISFQDGINWYEERMEQETDFKPITTNYIEGYALFDYDGPDTDKFIEGINWYREQLKQRQ